MNNVKKEATINNFIDSERNNIQNSEFQKVYTNENQIDVKNSIENTKKKNIWSKIKMPKQLKKQNSGIKNLLHDYKENLENDLEDLRENLPFTKEKKSQNKTNVPKTMINNFFSQNVPKKRVVLPSYQNIGDNILSQEERERQINSIKFSSIVLNNDMKTDISVRRLSKINSFIELTNTVNQRKISLIKEKVENNDARYNRFPRKIISNIEKGTNIQILDKYSDNISLKEDEDLLKAEKLIEQVNQQNIDNRTETDIIDQNILDMNCRELGKFKNVYDSLSFSEEISEELSDILIDPLGTFKQLWDFLMIVMILYSMIVTPYLICFLKERSLTEFVFEFIVEISFIIDFGFNFITPFYDKEENLITDVSEIILNYLEESFFFDLLTCIPFSMIAYALILKYPMINGNYYPLVKFVFCLQWIRLLRIFKLEKSSSYKFFSEINYFDDTRINRLIKFLLYFGLVIHVTSCLWVFIGRVNYDENNWIKSNDLNDFDKIDIYIASVYFNMVTIYTIGYGDITAVNQMERIYLSFFMFVGVLLFSFTVSNFSTFLTITDKKSIDFQSKVEIFAMINKDHDIHKNLYKKIKRFLYVSYKNSYDERYNLLESLPTKLKNDLTIFMYKNHIKELNFFKEQSHDLILFVLPMLKTHNIKKGDTLFSVGEYIEEMYLVIRGSLVLTLSDQLDNIEICQIRANQHFGEIFLETNEQSPYELKCKSKNTEMLVLKKNDYLNIKNVFSENIVEILKKSYDTLERIDKKKKVILELLKIDDNPQSIKKFMKIINREMMMNDFDNYYNNDENFVDDVDYLVQNQDKLTKIFKNTIIQTQTNLEKKQTKIENPSESPKQNSRKMSNNLDMNEVSCSRNSNLNYSFDNFLEGNEKTNTNSNNETVKRSISKYLDDDKIFGKPVLKNNGLTTKNNILIDKKVCFTLENTPDNENKIKLTNDNVDSVNTLRSTENWDLHKVPSLNGSTLKNVNEISEFQSKKFEGILNNVNKPEENKSIEKKKLIDDEKYRSKIAKLTKSKRKDVNVTSNNNTLISQLLKNIDINERNQSLLQEQKDIQNKAKSLLKYDSKNVKENKNKNRSISEVDNTNTSINSDLYLDSPINPQKKKPNESEINSFIIINNHYFNKGNDQKMDENSTSVSQKSQMNDSNNVSRINKKYDFPYKKELEIEITKESSFEIMNSYSREGCSCRKYKLSDPLVIEKQTEFRISSMHNHDKSNKRSSKIKELEIVLKEERNTPSNKIQKNTPPSTNHKNTPSNTNPKKEVNRFSFSRNSCINKLDLPKEIRYVDEINLINVDQELKNEINIINKKLKRNISFKRKMMKANKALDDILTKIGNFNTENTVKKDKD
jgi:hypothetical protein